MTAHRYSAPNKTEITTIRPIAPIDPDAAARDGIPRMITADAQPASAEARTYFQTAPITGAIPKRAGLPAYQSAGIVRIQKETTQATAIPTGPHGSPRRKSRPVTANSTTDQRNHRSALPMERWIHPWVPYRSIIPIPGAKNVKIRPDSSHPGPSRTTTRSLPIRVRPAPSPMPTKARVDSARRKNRPCCVESRVNRLRADTATVVRGAESWFVGRTNRSYAFL